VPVAGGMGDVPIPGALDDGADVLKLGGPAEFAFDSGAAGDEARGVSGAARLFDYGDLFAADGFACCDDFADAGAAAGAEVEFSADAAVEVLDGEHVGLGEVDDMDVVADAGTVGGRIVGAVD